MRSFTDAHASPIVWRAKLHPAGAAPSKQVHHRSFTGSYPDRPSPNWRIIDDRFGSGLSLSPEPAGRPAWMVNRQLG